MEGVAAPPLGAAGAAANSGLGVTGVARRTVCVSATTRGPTPVAGAELDAPSAGR